MLAGPRTESRLLSYLRFLLEQPVCQLRSPCLLLRKRCNRRDLDGVIWERGRIATRDALQKRKASPRKRASGPSSGPSPPKNYSPARLLERAPS